MRVPCILKKVRVIHDLTALLFDADQDHNRYFKSRTPILCGRIRMAKKFYLSKIRSNFLIRCFFSMELSRK